MKVDRKVIEDIIDTLIEEGSLPPEKRELAIRFAEQELDRKVRAVVSKLTDLGVTAAFLETLTNPSDAADDGEDQ